jgi:hypothetical protein
LPAVAPDGIVVEHGTDHSSQDDASGLHAARLHLRPPYGFVLQLVWDFFRSTTFPIQSKPR